METLDLTIVPSYLHIITIIDSDESSLGELTPQPQLMINLEVLN